MLFVNDFLNFNPAKKNELDEIEKVFCKSFNDAVRTEAAIGVIEDIYELF